MSAGQSLYAEDKHCRDGSILDFLSGQVGIAGGVVFSTWSASCRDAAVSQILTCRFFQDQRSNISAAAAGAQL